jgi:hypothetical protein
MGRQLHIRISEISILVSTVYTAFIGWMDGWTRIYICHSLDLSQPFSTCLGQEQRLMTGRIITTISSNPWHKIPIIWGYMHRPPPLPSMEAIMTQLTTILLCGIRSCLLSQPCCSLLLLWLRRWHGIGSDNMIAKDITKRENPFHNIMRAQHGRTDNDMTEWPCRTN